MSPDLIQALAQRLMDIYFDDRKAWLPLRDAHDAERAFATFAHECLRQMQWARWQSCDRHFGKSLDDHEYFNQGDWLTLAPKDWTP